MKYSRRQLVEQARLDAADHAQLRRCRGDHNRLGFAYQVVFVKLLGRLPQQEPLEIEDRLVTFAAQQANADAETIEEYASQRDTIFRHQATIREYLGLSRLEDAEAARLGDFIYETAQRSDRSASLIAQAREFLQRERVLIPADYKLERIVGEQRERARQEIFQRVVEALPRDFQRSLDEMLVVDDVEGSALQRIKQNPARPSPDGILALVNKMTLIEGTGVLRVDLSWLSSNYQRALYHHARKASVDRLRELLPARRYATMVCFLWQSYRDAVDQLVDMFDKLLTRTQTHAQNELDERMRKQRVLVRNSMSTLHALGSVILDDSVGDEELRSALFAKVPKDELTGYLNDVDEWVTGRSSHPFHGFLKRYSQLRKFAPALVTALQLRQDTEQKGPCLNALSVLAELNKSGKRKLPEDVPLGFLTKAQRPFVEQDGAVDRRAWECALLLRLRDEIRLGNVSVDHSKRFGPLDAYFMPGERWERARHGFFERAGMPSDPRQVPDYLGHRLGQAYDRFLASAPDNAFATVNEDGWKLSVDPTERLEEPAQRKLNELKKWLDARMRTINLADLLIEVDNDLGFTRHFLPASQRQEPSADDVCVALAAVMAHGCNIGPYTMSQLTRDISYKQLKRVSDWQLTEEAQRGALAELVSAISSLDTSLYWGEGRTSASDGQRFAMPHRVLQQTYSPKFSDFALEFYSFVADNYAPFYSTPIECTDRDSAVVLDGLLYNESDLPLEEHYTDTHGYTEISFAAFAMLGRRFCPRIRGVHHQRLYRVDGDRDYGLLSPLVARADRTIDTALIAEHWDRIGHLYASLEAGHATASAVMRRLVSFSPKNRFYRANRDLGRIMKTEFILQYMSEPALRGRVRRGLLKVEQLHALARDVFYGRRGRVNARELWEQMNSCSCLTLIVACIIYWQAREMARVIRQSEGEPHDIDWRMLQHVSPIEWDNVVLYGQYVLNRSRVRKRRGR